jgi:hypothetical protein
MKNFLKKNIWGIGTSVALGGLTFLLYLIGKGEGYIEACDDIHQELQKVIEEVDVKPTE